MKKIIILLVFVSGCGFLQAQTYVPFPDSNATWSEIDFYQGYCYPPSYCKYTLFINGDTIINSQAYHKIYSNDSSSNSYRGGLRENNKRIYYFDKDCTHDILLYDFNLNIGDSIRLSCGYCDTTYPMYMKVISIDSVLLTDMTYRKRINFNWGSEMSWIEGIGSKYGLLYPYYTCILCVCWTELVCFQHSGLTLYSNEGHVPCFIYFVSNNELTINSNQLNIFPNPANNKLFIDVESETELINGIEFYDMLGAKTKTIQNISSKKTQIQTHDFSTGIYIIKVQLSNDRYIYRKLIIK